MFVVLRPVAPEKGYFKRRKQIKSVMRSPAVICRNEGSLPFCVVDIASDKRGIIWSGVEEKCGRYASRIVAPRSISLPDGGNFKRFVPSSMAANLVFNTAVAVISGAAPEPDSFVVTVTDRCGLSASRICELLPLCSAVRIVTSKPERYASACEKALTEFGATLVLRSAYEPTQKPDIVISCDGAICAAMSDAAVFTHKKRTCGKIRFCGNGITLTPEHSDFLPEGIDPLDFAGAVTELCGCSDYSSACFSEISLSCQKCAEPSAASCLLCHIRANNA